MKTAPKDTEAELIISLFWESKHDLNLYFKCHNGEKIGNLDSQNELCKAKYGKDMKSDDSYKKRQDNSYG